MPVSARTRGPASMRVTFVDIDGKAVIFLGLSPVSRLLT